MTRLHDLYPGEIVVEQFHAEAIKGLLTLRRGRLYVTNRRILWERNRFSLGIPTQRMFEIPLNEVARVRSGSFLGAFGNLKVECDGKSHIFIPYSLILAVGIFFNGRLARKAAAAIRRQLLTCRQTPHNP